MECDHVIDPKLEKYEAVKACFSKSFTCLVSGGTGSGKTTWVVQMVKSVFKKCFHDIFLIIPENSLNSISEADNVFRKYLDEEHIFHEYTPEVLQNIYDRIEANAGEGYTSLLIIDDFGADLKSKPTELILNRLCLKNRHLRCSTIILAQNYFMLGKKIREIVNNVVLFNTNKSQNRKFFDEQFDFGDKQFKELMSLLKTTHDYFIINLKYKRIFFNCNEVIFD